MAEKMTKTECAYIWEWFSFQHGNKMPMAINQDDGKRWPVCKLCDVAYPSKKKEKCILFKIHDAKVEIAQHEAAMSTIH